MILRRYKKRRNAYSLLEVLVALGIISIIILIFFNSLIVSFKVSFKSSNRSFVREEISAAAFQMVRDIRNADIVTDCGQLGGSENCTFELEGKIVRWYKCDSSICREEINGANTSQTYRTVEQLAITSLAFEPGYDSGTNNIDKNILITLVGGHSNPELEITNIVRQTSVSTRNYEL